MDLVIIGAPRSGTNMLRDVLTALPGFATWDCDEINLTWRHGNRDVPHDELEPDQASRRVRDYVGGRFEALRSRTGADVVVEKTCANSLRVGFVHAVRPEARFVLITRDGLDAAASAMQRWHAPLDLAYTARKVRHAPWRDLPHYGLRWARNRWERARAAPVPDQAAGHRAESAGHGWWGPKPRDWGELTRTHPLDEICLAQWQRCVVLAERDLDLLPAEQVHRITYEEFVGDPAAATRHLLASLGRSDRFDERAVAAVRSASVGKGRRSFDASDRERLGTVAGPTLARLGYGC